MLPSAREILKLPPTRRGQLLVLIGVVVFVIGLVTLVRFLIGLVPDFKNFGKPLVSNNIKTMEVLGIDKANFNYLIPGKSDAWSYDETSPAFDSTTGVVKYAMKMKFSQVNVTISQQKFPEKLESRKSDKFMSFVTSSNPSRSQDVGRGTVFFMAALENGAPANGADTIIFATDDVLMFGRAGRVIGYDAWANMLATMKPH